MHPWKRRAAWNLRTGGMAPVKAMYMSMRTKTIVCLLFRRGTSTVLWRLNTSFSAAVPDKLHPTTFGRGCTWRRGCSGPVPDAVTLAFLFFRYKVMVLLKSPMQPAAAVPNQRCRREAVVTDRGSPRQIGNK